MSKNYKLSNEALRDLNNIWVYAFEKWSKDQADKYYSFLLEQFSFISSNHESSKSFEHIREGYRVFILKKHLIFYKVNNDVVEIIRILHHKMKIEKHLK